jgi:hypothetical protein
LPLAVDAGAAKVLAFPAMDLTLFGHATAPDNAPLTVQWTPVSGPAAVRFSAPQALATTVTFTTPGTYVFQLAASDGTATVTSTVQVTVTPATSQTAFYVDPTYTGSTQNGTAQAPWRAFEDGNPNYHAQWAAINSALATNPVIIYFSARQASADTPEEIVGTVRVSRTDKSSNGLTLDGMSKYNTNDANPSWVDYTGTHKMRIRATGGSMGLGWSVNDISLKMHYVTMRGFEVTGHQARTLFGGSHTVLEYIWAHDITGLDPAVLFAGAVSDDKPLRDIGKDNDITVRNILIERCMGEGLYIAGNYLLASDGGWPEYGNTHSDILLESNTIRDAGVNGAEGDGIDLKAGLQNVTIRNNVISGTYAPPADVGGELSGITMSGTFPPTKTHFLVEGNRIFNGLGNGIALVAQNNIVIRNNLIYNMTGSGIAVYDDPQFPNNDVKIYNNTIYGNAGSGVGANTTKVIVLRNNLIFGNTAGNIQTYVTTHADSDYNLMAPTGADDGFPEGPHSIVQTSTDGITVDPAKGDFHLGPASPAINKGADLSTTGFATDFDGILRPQGTAWDIGAYEFVVR